MKAKMLMLSALCLVLGAQAELVAYRDYDAQTGTFMNAVFTCINLI